MQTNDLWGPRIVSKEADLRGPLNSMQRFQYSPIDSNIVSFTHNKSLTSDCSI